MMRRATSSYPICWSIDSAEDIGGSNESLASAPAQLTTLTRKQYYQSDP